MAITLREFPDVECLRNTSSRNLAENVSNLVCPEKYRCNSATILRNCHSTKIRQNGRNLSCEITDANKSRICARQKAFVQKLKRVMQKKLALISVLNTIQETPRNLLALITRQL
ncbi:hypothetical protein BBBOND_0206540 [Babesia bigemina]|uniref:Uncharacterized protein n=1 Tax=Babesia bigemina TaxID=5866 RepID=A0A061D426_BABBI|nr:hypothetical protein BBBOND_0206540 [Babesia bigemina]CDR95496.1 hypothetical protein BBBOND_0206540 [Babesia bigemina]|eukprot:XP_012767682.1 hypothetical protein BBBOND_0206540 [Babesia bigemina]